MITSKTATLRIGTSGYEYPHWSGDFYPESLPRNEWFEHYAAVFDTVEINNTFYHLPATRTFEEWRARAPAGFLYILKYSRYGSHMKRLKAPRSHVNRFVDRAAKLGKHLGPILVQLPPHWHADVERLDAFLAAAPRRFRWALEFRDPDWLCDEVFETLRNHGAALCIHDMISDHPHVVTADWVYLRYHGPKNGGDYPHQALVAEARRIRKLLGRNLDVYAYFNNDQHGHAVRNAAALRRYVHNAIRRSRRNLSHQRAGWHFGQ